MQRSRLAWTRVTVLVVRMEAQVKTSLSKPRWVVLLFLCGAAVIGCGGDSTGPSGANLEGTWGAAWTNMSGSGSSCSLSGLVMVLAQSGTTFSGSYSNGQLSCGGQLLGTVAGIVVNGTVSGSSVSFDLQTSDLHQSGTVSGSSMSGQATWRIDTGSGVVTLTGNWGASKQ